MARTKPERRITTWQEADETLLAIGRLERQLEGLEADLQGLIEEAKAETVTAAKPLLEQRNLLALELELYCEAHREEFGDKKTRELNYGRVSFRQSTRILIKGIKDCLTALREAGWLDCLRVSESPNKENMKRLADEDLARVGARREVKDVFAYEVDRERVREAL